MSLKQQVEKELKEALKAGDKVRLSTLRFLLAGIKNFEIEKQREATDEDVIEVVQKQVKQHKESIAAYAKAGRADLEAKESQELEILSKFLPQQLSQEEVRVIVTEVINYLSETDRKNFGKIMGQTMAQIKGRADGNLVSNLVKEVLSQ